MGKILTKVTNLDVVLKPADVVTVIKSLKPFIMNKQTAISKNGYTYNKLGYNEFPAWVKNKWESIKRNNSPMNLEKRDFYFKGDNYRYLIKVGSLKATGKISPVFEFEKECYKRERTHVKNKKLITKRKVNGPNRRIKKRPKRGIRVHKIIRKPKRRRSKGNVRAQKQRARRRRK